MKKDHDNFILEFLQGRRYEKLYLNVARMHDGSWAVCWDARWCAADTLTKACMSRRAWLEHLQEVAPGTWTARSLRTIRVF